MFGTCTRNTHSIEKYQDLLGSVLFSTNSPTPAAPVCAAEWIFASMTIQTLLPASWTKLSAHTIKCISELSRSPFGFGSSVSLSTLRFLCYRRKRKTRYVVVWLTPFYDGTFTRKFNTALPSAPSITSLHMIMKRHIGITNIL